MTCVCDADRGLVCATAACRAGSEGPAPGATCTSAAGITYLTCEHWVSPDDGCNMCACGGAANPGGTLADCEQRPERQR
jgi:hypothetical protein